MLILEIIINSSRKQIAEVFTTHLLTTVSLSPCKIDGEMQYPWRSLLRSREHHDSIQKDKLNI